MVSIDISCAACYQVLTVDFAKDGKHFASGGADHTVIIWTSKAEGVLKYTHNESILRLAYSPGTTKLASCTQFDFGLWRQEQKSVIKHKVGIAHDTSRWIVSLRYGRLLPHVVYISPGLFTLNHLTPILRLCAQVHAKILSADWSPDGLHLALGFFDGHVGIRDVEGVEKITITRWVVNDGIYSLMLALKIHALALPLFFVLRGVPPGPRTFLAMLLLEANPGPSAKCRPKNTASSLLRCFLSYRVTLELSARTF